MIYTTVAGGPTAVVSTDNGAYRPPVYQPYPYYPPQQQQQQQQQQPYMQQPPYSQPPPQQQPPYMQQPTAGAPVYTAAGAEAK